VNVNIPAPETMALQLGPKIRNDNSLKNGFNDFDSISGSYKNHILK
jgi:hypothetical protein